MDEDSGATQTDDSSDSFSPPQDNSGGSLDGIKRAAESGKEIVGATKNLAGALAGKSENGGGGGGVPGVGGGGIPGVGGGGVPGVGGSPKPSGPQAALKASETGSTPHGTNSVDDETNPSKRDADQKMQGGSSKTAQAINDAAETVKDVKDVAEAMELNPNAIKNLVQRDVLHPVETAKRGGRLLKYFAIFEGFQLLVVVAILGLFFFGLYKVFLTTKSAWKPTEIANTLRVGTEMGGYLAKFVTQLSYEREQAEHSKAGVVFAESANQKNYNLSDLKVNPETQKMYEAWDNAGLAAKFLDDFHAKIVPNGSVARQVDSYNPAAWDLYVKEKYIGPLNSDRAMAFISGFADDTTHWSDIYTRVALKDAAKTKFDTSTFKLDLPNSKNNLDNSRENFTKKLVSDTLKPISTSADVYTKCLTSGGKENCDTLGLGSKNSPSNIPPSDCGSGLGGLICNIVTAINNLNDQSKVSSKNLADFSGTKGTEVSPDSSKYENKASLAANISTGASDAVLQGITDPKNPSSPNSEVLLQMYDQFQTATDNQNFSRVNYDRTAKQSVAESENYFIAGGQLLNNDMSILDSWALTENLSTLESSQTFRAAVLGSPVGLYAQDSNALDNKTCQKVYNDEDPVKSIKENPVNRAVKNSSCFTQSLVPNLAEFKNEKTLNQIYDQLDTQNNQKKSGSWISNIVQIFQKKQADFQNKLVRRSPVSASAVNIDPSLSPDFDAYTNQVYGVAKTGAEVDGQAYDTMKMAAESLWSSAATNSNTSLGGSYQDNASVAKSMQYATKFERLKLSFKPLGQRLFALKNPDSLFGKLALLTPTNPRDGVKKSLALMSPTNLTGAVASRMTPMTFAQSATTEATVNPVGAVRVGYSSSDPSNTMDSQKLWDTYKCGEGGIAQTTTQPEGIPFTLPNSVDPCKRQTMLSTVATCYLTPGDTCNKGSDTLSSASSSSPGAKGVDTSKLSCAPGASTERIVTIAGGVQRKLCTYGAVRDVDASWSNDVKQMLDATSGQISLSGGGFRTADEQIRLRREHCGSSQYAIYQMSAGSCHPPTAKPGTSNHELGMAIDFSNCSTRGTACYQWLASNASRFNIKNLKSEPWHWSYNGS